MPQKPSPDARGTQPSDQSSCRSDVQTPDSLTYLANCTISYRDHAHTSVKWVYEWGEAFIRRDEGAVEPFLDNFHVKQTKETATKAKT